MTLRTMSLIKSCALTARLTVAAIVCAASILVGCSADPRDVMHSVKEIKPELKKRNQELRELSGVKEEKGR